MSSIKTTLLFILLSFSYLGKCQIPVQTLEFPSTIFFGGHLAIADDGSYLATFSASSGSTATDLFIYKLVENKYELDAKLKFTFEITEIDFASDGKTIIVGEGLGNIFRTARVYYVELSEDGMWFKNNIPIQDPEENDAASGQGYSVSGNGDIIALGVPSENKVYTYKKNIEGVAEMFTPPLEGNPAFSFFGFNISLSGDGMRMMVTSGNPMVSEIYDFENSEWNLKHTFDFFQGKGKLSFDGKSLLISHGKEIQICQEDQNGDWDCSASISLFTDSQFGWNIASVEFEPEYGRISTGMLNASNQKTKFATLDKIEGQWIERRNPFYDQEFTDYGGIEVASTVEGSLFVNSRPRFNNNKGIIYIYNDLKGSALGVAAFRDVNRNGEFDDGEYFFTDCSFTINENVELIALEGYNYASVYGPSKEVALNYDDEVFLTTTPDILTYNHGEDELNKLLFGIDYIEPQIEGDVYVYNSTMICNTVDENYIRIQNIGTEPIYFELELVHEGLVFNSSNIEIISQTDSKTLLRTETINPGEIFRVINKLKMPNETFSGNLIGLSVNATLFTPNNPDPVSTNEFDASFTLRCSYDPNDKAVYPEGLGEELFTLKDQDLVYKIRFQNTGNFPAANVRVQDEIDENLDLSTIKILETSHELTQLTNRDRVLDFVFENIMLADSVNNEPESHGYIIYSIRPVDNILDFTEITNTADIYFDLNAPIITNTTVSNMVDEFPSVSVDDTFNDKVEYKVYPNPVADILNFEVHREVTIYIYDQLGRSVKSASMNATNSSILMSDLPTGVYSVRILDNETKISEYINIVKN